MQISIADVELAYRKLKSLIYYDKTDLKLRSRLATFECSEKFDIRLNAVCEVLNEKTPKDDKRFKRWLSEISFRVVPKKVNSGQNEQSSSELGQGRFITNVTSTKTIEVEKVNYFFDGPIELHLIAVLWIMFEGRFLDANCLPECCGSRLSGQLNNENDETLELFTKYHEQYSRWRDSGIRKAKQLLVDEQRNVAVLGLDIQEYFYRIDIEYNDVASDINSARERSALDGSIDTPILSCIEAIGLRYRESIESRLCQTHTQPNIDPRVAGLPIGLCSSLVLANWYLHDFDKAILKKIRPAYYGRYVDDILIVIPMSQDPTFESETPVEDVVEALLVKPRILKLAKQNSYEVCLRPGLILQQAKCILQYFDSRHSIAGLEKFQKKLEQNGSDFLLLPVDEADNSMEDVAYELLYEGSINKFRSVKGLAENRYELAKHLARQTSLHLMTDDPPDRKIGRGLQQFFKGRNAIEFFDLWERVFTLLGIAGDKTTVKIFLKQLNAEIKRVRNHHDTVTELLQDNLNQHLRLSLAMSDAVCTEDIGLSELLDGIHSEEFRRANLMRHHFVKAPLLNYTTYTGPLSERNPSQNFELDKVKLERSPRFVNFDECMLLAYSGNIELKKKAVFEFASDLYRKANRSELNGVSWIQQEISKDLDHD